MYTCRRGRPRPSALVTVHIRRWVSIMTDVRVPGLHHVTALSGAGQDTVDFYVGVLGLRLVKETVNFDDPMNHHLYYGDTVGRPGTLLTVFPWPQVRPGRPGAGMVEALSFAVPEGSLGKWTDRLEAADVSVETGTRFDEEVLRFEDPAGLPLELIGAPLDDETAWTEGAVPAEAVVQGLHAATLPVFSGDRTRSLFTDLFDWTQIGEEANRVRLRGPGDGPGTCVDLLVRDRHPSGRMGRGMVHHVAFRTPDAERQRLLQAQLRERGIQVSDVTDRRYFGSIYFRDPDWTSGLLFEIATDGPGFLTDEPESALGQALQLPPSLEDRRDEIQAALPALSAPSL